MVQRFSIVILFLSLLLQAFACDDTAASENSHVFTADSTTKKMNGVNLVAPSKPVEIEVFNPIREVGADWVAIIPYGFGPENAKKIQWNVEWQYWGEREAGVRKCIQMAKAKNMKVMVKPQVWFHHGSFTGDFNLETDKEWEIFEATYEGYILDYAKIAQDEGAELYCIGTEWKNFIAKRPQFWKQLIPKVRALYKGELTFAANWDNYANIPFWDDLDYIGIDAYFPLTEEKSPSTDDFLNGWKKHINGIEKLAQQKGKKVIFTEYGYRNIDYTGAKPWESGRNDTNNEQAQVNGYEALYQTFWKEAWFAGGFLWKWHPSHKEVGGKDSNRFTPQRKAAEATVRKWYKGE